MMDVAFNITRRCNKRCSYCYLELKDEELSFEQIGTILDSVDARAVTLTGGEPLIHTEFPEILKKSSEVGHVHLLTNGLLLDESKIELLVECETELFVTYNLPDSELAEKLFLAYNKGVSVNAHHVLTDETVDKLGIIYDESPFLKSITFLYPTDSGKGNVEMYQPSEWFNILKRAIDTVNEHGIKTYFEQAFVKKSSEIASSPPCPTGHDLFIDSDGRNYPCCLLVDKIQGGYNLTPIKTSAEECPFLMENNLLADSDYIRICPIVVTDSPDSSFKFPSHLEDS